MDEMRPASPAIDTGFRSAVGGGIAANLGAIAVHYLHQFVPADIQGPVDDLTLTVTAALVAGLIGWWGAKRRDDKPENRSLRRTPF